MPVDLGGLPPAARALGAHAADTAVCILAAGLAKRLEPISNVIAKPAFPLAGRIPIVELWVRKFVDAGVTTIAMNLHRVPESIRGYFGDGARFMADITYAYEETPSGTLGGAIAMLRALRQKGVTPARVFIPSGDIVSNIDLEQLRRMIDTHVARGAAATLMLAPVPWDRRADFGTVVLQDVPAGHQVGAGTFERIVDFREKEADSPSNENNASNYLIETSLLLELEPHLTPAAAGQAEPCYDFGKHVFPAIMGKVPHLSFLSRYKDRLFGFEPGALWYDIGNKRDYLDVNRAALRKEIPLSLPYAEHPWGWMGDDVTVDFSQVTIRPPVVLGHHTTIGNGAEIGPNAVIGDGWTVGANARVADAVLWRHTGGRGAAPAIADGVTVETAVAVGGAIDRDVREATVDQQPDGTLDVRSLDWVPAGPRA